MLKIENITKTFNRNTINEKTALNNLSLTIQTGDFISIIGSNGAGKSTLLNAIAGSWALDDGKIFIDDTDITKMNDYQRAKFIGRVFQDPMMGSAADMWVEENLALALRRGKKRGLKIGVTNKEREEFVSLLKPLNLGLENRLSTKVGLLSGGQRQALTLLMATIRKPDILLLDEHTAALDPATAATVLNLTDRLVNDNNLTTIMITHNMNDAIRYGNRLIMMHEGKIILDISGKDKKSLTASQLIEQFEIISGTQLNDSVLLSK